MTSLGIVQEAKTAAAGQSARYVTLDMRKTKCGSPHLHQIFDLGYSRTSNLRFCVTKDSVVDAHLASFFFLTRPSHNEGLAPRLILCPPLTAITEATTTATAEARKNDGVRPRESVDFYQRLKSVAEHSTCCTALQL